MWCSTAQGRQWRGGIWFKCFAGEWLRRIYYSCRDSQVEGKLAYGFFGNFKSTEGIAMEERRREQKHGCLKANPPRGPRRRGGGRGRRSKENIPMGKHISIFLGKIFAIDTFPYFNLKKNYRCGIFRFQLTVRRLLRYLGPTRRTLGWYRNIFINEYAWFA